MLAHGRLTVLFMVSAMTTALGCAAEPTLSLEDELRRSCGNDKCTGRETCGNCPVDCGECSMGDAGMPVEDAGSADAGSADAGTTDPDPTTCGDGTCGAGEDSVSCPADCGTVTPTLYVSTSGSDSSPGTASQPFRTVEHAADVAGPGDVVWVNAGTYRGDFTISRSGSPSAPITFVGASGAQLVTDRTEGDASVWIRADHIVLRGFDIEGNVHVRGHYNVIAENTVHDAYEKGGIELSASERNATDCTHNVVRDNVITRTVGTGIYIEGQYQQVLRNEISRVVDHAPDGSNQTDADGIRFFGSHHLVQGNYIHDIWQTDMAGAPHIDMMQTWQEAHDIVFDGNVMHNPNPTGSNRILMLERQEGAGPVSNLTWVNNIFIFSDDTSAAMNFNRKSGQPEITNMVVVNNVFYSPSGLIEKAAGFSNITGVTFRNNLVINTGLNGNAYVELSNGTSGTSIGHNAIYNTDGSVPDDGPYPNDLWDVDPRVVDLSGATIEALDFRPRDGSPLIDAGTTHSYTDHDHDGTPRPLGSGFDIGAFEATP